MNNLEITEITEVGAERLRTLYAIMDGIPDDLVDLRNWRCGNETTNSKLMGCGTRACAVGWACAYPEFMAQGLNFDASSRMPTFLGYQGWMAVCEFFCIDQDVAETLFQPAYHEHDIVRESQIRTGELDHDLSEVQIVKRRIRRALMQAGYISTERNAELARKERVGR